jgi:hypothetical protein
MNADKEKKEDSIVSSQGIVVGFRRLVTWSREHLDDEIFEAYDSGERFATSEWMEDEF